MTDVKTLSGKEEGGCLLKGGLLLRAYSTLLACIKCAGATT